MPEKYFFENGEGEITINIGHFVNKIFAKHVADYGQQNAEKTRERIKGIFKNALIQIQTHQTPNLLLIGKVQSGKTSNLEMFTAFAFDNGFKTVIIYGGYDTKLLAQTSNRFRQTFDVSESSLEPTEPELFSTDDSGVDALDEDILNKVYDLGKPVIFVSMKRPAALAKINNVLGKISQNGRPAFIIDDEGDQASLNTEFKKQKKSPTYAQIVEMKAQLENPLYLSVTATPQANVLLGDYSSLKPAKLYLIEPGKGYTGAEFFHLDEDRIVRIDKEDVDQLELGTIPNSVYVALHHFFIASVFMMRRGIDYSDMIIHTSRRNKDHGEVYSTLYSYIQSLKENIKDNNEETAIQLAEIADAYTEDYFDKDLITETPFDDIQEDLKKVIRDTHLILQDSQGKLTQGNEKFRLHKIYIGGDLLQRGLTFKHLVTTYFTRWPKKSGNMDTTMQRARWFGYRSKFLDLCKLFMTSTIQSEYAGLTETENDLWEQCYLVQQGEMTISDIVIDADSTSLNPTRKNVVSYKSVKFSKKWNNQKTGFFDEETNKKNNQIVEEFLNDLSFTPSTIGRINSTVPSCFYAEATYEQLKAFLNAVYGIFDYDPFNKNDILKICKDHKIVIQKMFGLEGQLDYRKRSFNSDTNRILALQQGPDKSDEQLQHYQGDSYVLVDADAVTFQVFRVCPRFENKLLLIDQIQYMFSIRVPKDRKGFVKNEFKTTN